MRVALLSVPAEMALGEFAEALASEKPVPGGGAAAGITAALGSAGATIWTVLVGHSGAESVWGGLA